MNRTYIPMFPLGLPALGSLESGDSRIDTICRHAGIEMDRGISTPGSEYALREVDQLKEFVHHARSASVLLQPHEVPIVVMPYRPEFLSPENIIATLAKNQIRGMRRGRSSLHVLAIESHAPLNSFKQYGPFKLQLQGKEDQLHRGFKISMLECSFFVVTWYPLPQTVERFDTSGMNDIPTNELALAHKLRSVLEGGTPVPYRTELPTLDGDMSVHDRPTPSQPLSAPRPEWRPPASDSPAPNQADERLRSPSSYPPNASRVFRISGDKNGS